MTTINSAGAGSALAGTERFPGEATPFDGSAKGYWTPTQFKTFVLSGLAGTSVSYTPAGGISATTISGAIAELDTEKAPIASPTFTGTVGGITATMVGNTAHGNIASTTVQDAINELEDEKSPVLHGGHVAGRWYTPWNCRMLTGTAPVANTITLIPFVISEKMTISDLGARVTTLAASGNFQLAIYAADASTKKPTGNALASTGNISTASATAISADITGADVQLSPGVLYWFAFNCDASAGGTCTMQVLDTGTANSGFFIGSATFANVNAGANTLSMYYQVTSQTFGTWPSLTGATFNEISSDIRYCAPWFKVSSVP